MQKSWKRFHIATLRYCLWSRSCEYMRCQYAICKYLTRGDASKHQPQPPPERTLELQRRITIFDIALRFRYSSRIFYSPCPLLGFEWVCLLKICPLFGLVAAHNIATFINRHCLSYESSLFWTACGKNGRVHSWLKAPCRLSVFSNCRLLSRLSSVCVFDSKHHSILVAPLATLTTRAIGLHFS